jgi:hypothetical protein
MFLLRQILALTLLKEGSSNYNIRVDRLSPNLPPACAKAKLWIAPLEICGTRQLPFYLSREHCAPSSARAWLRLSLV